LASTPCTARAHARLDGPTLDIAFVIEQIGDAKELVQTVIEQKPE
jgi:hypothetical protein